MKHQFNQNAMRMMNPMYEKEQRRGRVAGGLLIIAFGALWLAKTLGVVLPFWLFSGYTFLIALGIYLQIKHGGRKMHGLGFLAIGVIGLADKMVPGIHIGRIAWPVLIMAFGVYILFRSKGRKQDADTWSGGNTEGFASDDSTADYIKINSVFGGVEKSVISKNFRGGQINSVFGGSEINLMQADFSGKADLEINVVFGGAEIAVPGDWKVQNEITAILGGIEDKRPVNPAQADSGKTLVLRGACVFGGVEIKGF